MEERRRQWSRLLEQVKTWAVQLARTLKHKGIRVQEIILFGSLARGTYTLDSDVDLVIISPDWRGLPLTERLRLLYRLWDKPQDATLIPLIPEEYRGSRSIAIMEARKYGIKLYRDEDN